MSPPGKVCPVCDTQVQEGVKKCPSCGTDLTLFEVELDLSSDNLTSFANAVIGDDKKSLDEIINTITSSDAPKAQPADDQAGEKFACPSCGSMLAVDATQCHSCGVEFTEDVVEQFECPVCNSIVEGTANKCPSCGAEFATEEESSKETVASPKGVPEQPVEAKPPATIHVDESAPAETSPEEKRVILTQKAPPMVAAPEEPAPQDVSASAESVVDELAPKEEQVPAELSFMERMKLIREKRMKEDVEMKTGTFAPKPTAQPQSAAQAKPAVQTPSPKPTIQQPAAKPAAPQTAVPRIKTSPSETGQTTSAPSAKPPVPVPQGQSQTAKPSAPAQTIQPAPRPAAVPPTAHTGPKPSLSDLVKDMKPLLQMARDLDVDITRERGAIDQAIKAAKSKDSDAAVGLLIDAKSSVERALIGRLAVKLDGLEAEGTQARSSGLDVARVEGAIRDARTRMEQGNVAAAKEAVDMVARGLSGNIKETLDANEAIKSATELAARARNFGMDVGEAEQTLKLAQGFLATGDLHKGSAYAKRAKELLSHAVPEMVKEEMRKAKADLLSAKMLGKDITRPMAIMKNASLALKSEDYEEALRSISQFKEAMKML